MEQRPLPEAAAGPDDADPHLRLVPDEAIDGRRGRAG